MSEKLFQHALNFYEALDKEATNETHDGVELRIFRGLLTSIYRKLEISNAYYSKIRKPLVEFECITVLEQGARGTPSVVVLHHPPVAQYFTIRRTRDLTGEITVATLSQRLDDLERRMGGKAFDLIRALRDIDDRLRELRNEVDKIGKKPQKQARRRTT